MRRNDPRTSAVDLLRTGMTLCGAAGGCLPPNFFADLAGEVVSAAVLQVVDAAVANVIDDDVADAKAGRP
jgi:hypothetical protein